MTCWQSLASSITESREAHQMAGGEGGNAEADVHHRILGRFFEIVEFGTDNLTEPKCSRKHKFIRI